jgi:hypothetical protein
MNVVTRVAMLAALLFAAALSAQTYPSKAQLGGRVRELHSCRDREVGEGGEGDGGSGRVRGT